MIIGREITISALREWAATLGGAAREAVAVSSWGKVKTVAQMVSLALLLASRAGGGAAGWADATSTLGVGLLAVAALLSVQSMALYIQALRPHLFK